MWPNVSSSSDKLVSAELSYVVLTSCFAVVDPAHGRLFLDQTYADVAEIFPTRFKLSNGAFELDSDPIPLAGRYLILGGPIDSVYYHWLFNWCPRMIVARQLRPDILDADDVRIVVHPLALEEPYYTFLESFGLPRERFLAIDPAKDYRLERACLVSFLDQAKLFPEVIHAFREHLLAAFSVDRDARHPGLFASRQAIPAPKRRIHNFDAVEPVLRARGIEIASLGLKSAPEQAQLFHAADLVLGAHGSDLSNFLFCRPRTPVVVIENRYSVAHKLHVGLEQLARVLDLDYRLFVSDTTQEPGTRGTPWLMTRDFVVDPAALAARLDHAVGKAEQQPSPGHKSSSLADTGVMLPKITAGLAPIRTNLPSFASASIAATLIALAVTYAYFLAHAGLDWVGLGLAGATFSLVLLAAWRLIGGTRSRFDQTKR